MRINHNIAALNTHRQLNAASTNQSKSMEKLSSGLRINKAGDDAAGLAISGKMRGQIRGLDMAAKNAQDANSLIQTAEGALNETHDILQRMRELSVQSSNDTNTVDDRKEIQKEIDQLVSEIDRIGTDTEFNTKSLLDGGAGITGTTSNSKVSIVSGFADVKGGRILTIDSVQAATKGSVAVAEGTNDEDIAVKGAGGSFTLNGTSITLNAGDDMSDLIEKVNVASAQTGVTAKYEAGTASTQGTLTFTTSDTGANAKIEISGLDALLQDEGAGAVSGFNGTNYGSNATATIDGVNTTGVDPSSITASGNVLTVHGGDYDGLELRVDPTLTSATNDIAVNITSNNTLSMQIGANENQTMAIGINDMRAEALGVNNIDVSSADNAQDAIDKIDDAINSVSAERSKLGAYQNRLDYTINNLSTSSENLTAAESRIRDVDYALAA